MAFDIDGLSYIPDPRGVNGTLLYTHETDPMATVVGANYFDNQNELEAFLLQQNVDIDQGTRIDILASDGRRVDVLQKTDNTYTLRAGAFEL